MRRTIITTVVIVSVSFALMAFIKINSTRNNRLSDLAEVKRGSFVIDISTTGELLTENSVDIMGPGIIRNSGIRMTGLKITDIVPEGTMVRKGDYVATLDKTIYDNTLKDEVTELNETVTRLQSKTFDTAVILSTLRDDIRNQVYVVEEAGIRVGQSLWDPPATQKHLGLDLDKERRHLEQMKGLYSMRVAQAEADMRNLWRDTEKQGRTVKELENFIKGLSVRAPADGMVIYKRDRFGNKIKTGSILFPFDPVVATLPDLSSFNSKAFVSEIDVNKIKKDQPVEIEVGVLHGKKFRGYVTEIANIGEQLSNSDSKMFEVLIKVEGVDPAFRPTMTTTNRIIVKNYPDVVYIPAECVNAGPDNIPYVFTKDRKKQIVVPGEANENDVIIEKGLAEGTSVFLRVPDNQRKFSLMGKELIGELQARENPDAGNVSQSLLLTGSN